MSKPRGQPENGVQPPFVPSLPHALTFWVTSTRGAGAFYLEPTPVPKIAERGCIYPGNFALLAFSPSSFARAGAGVGGFVPAGLGGHHRGGPSGTLPQGENRAVPGERGSTGDGGASGAQSSGEPTGSSRSGGRRRRRCISVRAGRKSQLEDVGVPSSPPQPLAPPSVAHGACPCVRARLRTVHLRTCVSVSKWAFR